MDEIVKALALKNELDTLRPLDEVQEGRIMQKFRLDWNYHSNHLEGNKLTYGETKALLLFGVTAQGKPLKDTLEMTGHNEAVDWVIDMVKGERPLTENFVRELHVLLLREPYTKKAITSEGQETTKRIAVGQYKTSANHVQTVTGEIFYFATPEETPAKMNELLDWYHAKKEDPETNPILFAAEFHYRFIRIHPFDDGNGRSARLLMNFILMQYGFPPVIIKTEDKENYFAALRLADAGELSGFVAYIAVNLNRSLEIMIAGAKGYDIEEDDDIDKELTLLNEKLSSYQENFEKEKATSLNDIYQETIIPLAENLEKKLKKSGELYHNKGIYIVARSDQREIESFKLDPLSKSKHFEPLKFNNIKIVVNYNSLNIKGLDDYRFYDEIIFNFELYHYEVKNYGDDEFVIRKYYDNLTESEQKMLVRKVTKNYVTKMDVALNNNKGQ